jgi:protein-arginine kinase activator protein McsA
MKFHIEEGCRYLSDSKHFKSLPKNCIFDKGKVGAGGTSLAISSKHPYVIAVPFVSLIYNKMDQHPHLFGVYAGISNADICDYIESTKTPIIMTTYDSIERVINAIKGVSSVKKFKLLIDEYHLLFTQYAFRSTAIRAVLENYNIFKEFCFMTATVLDNEFILDELKHVQIVEAVWPDTTAVKVHSLRVKSNINGAILKLINAFLVGEATGNVYIFLNSVATIDAIVKKEPRLTEENCNLVYSQNNRTKLRIPRGQLPSVLNGPVKPKKINILTSTAFEGSDIYDREGKIVIVSDGTKTNTLVDISTSFQQIAGRVRNSRYMRSITHIYSKTRYSDVTLKEHVGAIDEEVAKSTKIVEELNALPASLKKVVRTEQGVGEYVIKVDDEFVLDYNLVKLDIYNFRITNCLYALRVNPVPGDKEAKQALHQEYSSKGYTVLERTLSGMTTGNATKKAATDAGSSFKAVVMALSEFYAGRLFNCYNEEEEDLMELAFSRYSFLENGLEILGKGSPDPIKAGFEKIRELKYKVSDIKRTITKIELEEKASSPDINYQVFKALTKELSIKPGNFVPSKDIKEKLSFIYNSLGIQTTPKGSDIDRFFHTKVSTSSRGGKVVKGYSILGTKWGVK